MRLLAGTSGFSYPEWRGTFYPEGLAQSRMLHFYAEHLPAVEINSTFYRMPRGDVLARWLAEVPDTFVFVLKASQRITHQARLREAQDAVEFFWKQASSLGAQLGPLLFQLPPNLRADVQCLRDFCAALPAGCRGAFEFRHPSFRDDAVVEALAAARVALCVADPGPTDLVATADWGYLRLRRERYSDGELRGWADRIRRQPWREVFVFFKHEDEATAPALAQRFAQIFDGRAEQEHLGG
jgi:uncharacterized protein YecE (DUF72 family)